MERLKNFLRHLKENALWLVISTISVLTICMLLVDCFRTPQFAPPPNRYFQVDGVQYGLSSHNDGKRFLFKKIEPAGHITSTVDWPGDVEQDDQTNFGSVGAPYALIDGKMMIKLHGKWYTGTPQEKQ